MSTRGSFGADIPKTGNEYAKDIESVPKNQRVILITKNGIAVTGIYYAEGEFIAWSPIPKIPKHIKEKHNV